MARIKLDSFVIVTGLLTLDGYTGKPNLVYWLAHVLTTDRMYLRETCGSKLANENLEISSHEGPLFVISLAISVTGGPITSPLGSATTA